MIPLLKETSANFRRLGARLRGLVGKAIADFNMIGEGDRVMVCLSGGKDSYTLLDMLLSLQRAAPVRFDLCAVNMDQKQPGFPAHVLPEGRTQCGLCSRTRIALGHHRDDGSNVLIRPMCYVPEREIARYARAQRAAIGRMLAAWDREHPRRVGSIFTALCNIEPSHLADPRAFDFAGRERALAGPGS